MQLPSADSERLIDDISLMRSGVMDMLAVVSHFSDPAARPRTRTCSCQSTRAAVVLTA
jgi:hypothetical protein